ncbi:MAG: hypothetical protein ACLQMH_07820 [Solirubrobacteraceae bacterium]
MSEQNDILTALLDRLAAARDRLGSSEIGRTADTLLSGRAQLDDIHGSARESYRVAIESFCHVNDLDDVLEDAGVVHPYNYRKEFAQTPRGSMPDPSRFVPAQARPLLGHSVGFPIGVPASVLTADAKWVEYFARSGFNVLTFKTIRSHACAPSEFPNWVFLEDHDAPLPVGVNPREVVAHGDENTYLRQLRAFSTANSFGVPCSDPETWMSEVRASVELLRENQLLIVSVMGSSGPSDSREKLQEDFVKVSQMALEANAPAIELNLSCPNTLDRNAEGAGVKPPLCDSVEDTIEVVKAVSEAIDGKVPLVAKLGYQPPPRLRPLVRGLAPYVQAFSGINTLQVRVETARGGTTFGERQLAGISGIAIRHLAIDFVRSLKTLREMDDLKYEIIAMGGVMEPADVHALLAVGADAVQTATAASVNPNLPSELLAGTAHGDPSRDAEIVERIRQTLYADHGGFRSPGELAELLGLDVDGVERELNPLGELDLPRRVFELLAFGLPELSGPRIDQDIWGPGPSPERIHEVESDSHKQLDQQRQRLVWGSVTPDELGESLGWEIADVRRAIDAGELIYFIWGGQCLLPKWQLRDNPADGLLPGLPVLRRAFARDVVALDDWINAPNGNLDGRTPREALITGDADQALDSIVAIGAGL